MKLGINTYGLSKPLKKDFAGTMAALKAAGIGSIEPCVVFDGAFSPLRRFFYRCGFSVAGLDGGNFFGSAADRFCDKAAAADLTIRSVHCALCNAGKDTLKRMAPAALAFAERHGVKYYVVSLMTDSREKTQRYLAALRYFTDALTAAGVGVLYHNHDGELRGESPTPLDLLLREVPSLGLELDVGWASFAGCDPPELLRRYAGRIKIVHLKDIKAGVFDRRRCFAAVGEGSIPLSAIVAAAGNAQLDETGLVIDQDDSEGDLLRDIRVGAENVRKCLCD